MSPTILLHFLMSFVTSFERETTLNANNSTDNRTLVEMEKVRFEFALNSLEQMKPANKVHTLKILQDINILCDYFNVIDPQPVNSCPYYFDRTTCWRPVAAGSKSKRLCPSYIDGLSMADTEISISCNHDSTWNFHPSNMEEFLEVYGPCIEDGQSFYQRNAATAYLTSILRSAQIIGVIGYMISLISLLIATAIFLYFKRLHCARNVVHLHLFLAFMLRSFMCVLQYSLFRNGKSTPLDGEIVMDENGYERFADDASHWGCKFVISMWNYSLLVSYFWLLMEGLYLHNFVYLLVFQDTPLTIYVTLGWGIPFVLILPWVVVKLYHENHLCWIQYQNMNNFWILRGPIMFTIIINFCLCINICRELFIKLKKSHLKELQRYKRLARSTSLLITVLGGYYFIISIPVLIIKNDILTEGLLACLSIEHILSSLQGFLVAVIYCFCNHEVRGEIQRYWQRRLLLKSIPKPTDVCNHHIVTSRQKNSSMSAEAQKEILISLTNLTSPAVQTKEISRWKALWRKGVSKIIIVNGMKVGAQNNHRRSTYHSGYNSGTAFSTVSNSVYSTVHDQNAVRFYRNFNFTDHRQYEEKMTSLETSLFSRYNTNLRPVKDETHTVVVFFYAVLEHIEEVDEEEQSMTIHGFKYLVRSNTMHFNILRRIIHTQLWNDEYLSWDPGNYHGTNKINAHSWYIWKPDLVLYNPADQLEVSSKLNFNQHAWIDSDGRVEYFPMFRYKVACKFDFADYPHDIQECPIILGSWNYNLKELDIRTLLQKPMLNLQWNDEKVVISGWEVLDVHMNVTYWNVMTDEQLDRIPSADMHFFCYPLVNIWIRFKRHSPLHFITVLLPMLISSFITLAAFWAESVSQTTGLLSFNLLLQAILLEDVISETPYTTSSVPKIVTYFAFNMAASVACMVIIFLVSNKGYLKNEPQNSKSTIMFWSARNQAINNSSVQEENSQRKTEMGDSDQTAGVQLTVEEIGNGGVGRKPYWTTCSSNMVKRVSFGIILTFYFIFMILYLR